MKHNFYFIFIFCLLLTSCTSWFKDEDVRTPETEILQSNLTTISTQTSDAGKQVGDSSQAINTSAKEIKKETTEVKNKLPVEDKKKINSNLTKIDTHAETIIDQSLKLKNVSDKLNEVSEQLTASINDVNTLKNKIEELNKIIESKNSEIKSLNEKSASGLRYTMYGLIVAGILVIALAAVLIYKGDTRSVYVGGFGVVTVVLSLTVSIFYTQLAYIGLVVVIAVIIGIFLQIRDSKVYKKGFEEVVHCVEIIKAYLPQDQLEKLFGKGPIPGLLFNVQSHETESLVLKIRTENKSKWEKTINSSSN